MEHEAGSTGAGNAPAGWYPDPGGSPRQRYWDGARWTDALSPDAAATQTSGGLPGEGAPIAAASTSAVASSSSARTWAMAAHLSALLSLFIGLPFVGPLVVYLARKDDPYVRRHAAEALNFNLSVTIYGIVLGIVTVLLILVLVGVLLIPVLIGLGIAWIVFVVLGAVKASRGEDQRYPLTIRFVN